MIATPSSSYWSSLLLVLWLRELLLDCLAHLSPLPQQLFLSAWHTLPVLTGQLPLISLGLL